MNEKLIAYNPAAALVDNEEIAFFMADTVETGDSAYMARTRDAVARMYGMQTEIFQIFRCRYDLQILNTAIA